MNEGYLDGQPPLSRDGYRTIEIIGGLPYGEIDNGAHRVVLGLDAELITDPQESLQEGE